MIAWDGKISQRLKADQAGDNLLRCTAGGHCNGGRVRLVRLLHTANRRPASSGGPGYCFVRSRKAIAGLQWFCSGEHKGLDRFQGNAAEDTGITSAFLGPRVVASFGRVSGELAVELPVSIDNTALQVVPDYRLRGSVAILF